jgi:endo-1,4-beta-xylanase
MRVTTLMTLFGVLWMGPPAFGADFIKESPASLPGYNVHRPAEITGAAPVIVWANGGCVRSDFTWSKLFERWAREGFVVISITALPGAEPKAAPVRGGGSTADDQAKAIDWAIAENTAAGSPYAGRLDTRNIAAAGNSCGGITSLTLASRDKRPTAVFVLSGSSVGPKQTREQAAPVMSKVTVPVLFVVGGPDDIARGPANMDYDLLPDGVAAAVVERSAGDHPTVSTKPDILADVAEIGANWFKATLKHDTAALKTVTSTICAPCAPETWSVKSKHIRH